MKSPSTAIKYTEPFLSVSHKSASEISDLLHHLPDAVITTDLDFNITGWNSAAEKLHGIPGAQGKNLFALIKIELIDTSLEKVKRTIQQDGNWEGEIIFIRHDGDRFIFQSRVNTMLSEEHTPLGYIFINHNITRSKAAESKLQEAEATYRKVVNTLVDGVVMIDKNSIITTCNKRAEIILGYEENQLLGRILDAKSWKTIKPDGSVFPWYEFPAIVSLQTGFPQRNVKMGVEQPGGSLVWLSVNSEALIRAGEFEPYAVVVSFSDITEIVNREEELRNSNERFYYVSKVTSDAIWDIDLESKQIYRSDTFTELSGYSKDDVKPDMDWWFKKIHPNDRERVYKKVKEYIRDGKERWEDEYLFLCADGSYKYLLDSGTILYRHGKPVRILGAIRDLTEKKKLQQQLLEEQEQKHKAVSQAVIAAQETERGNISRELHDNVNQLLMSAQLFMNSALSDPEKSKEHIEKAIKYQMSAVEEIRKLSKELNTSLVKIVGLYRAIDDIIINMNVVCKIETSFEYDNHIDQLLSDDQKLMVYRILQEQTNNIIKYAGASKVLVSLREARNEVSLYISDDGKGFDTSVHSKGIGIINIESRVSAFGGHVELISSPGCGCKLKITFPLVQN